jgi:hypothetical protein
MWIVVALIFVILAIHKLVAGAIFGFLVLLTFAGFALFLFKNADIV